ncbi:MAG: hypothetical protein N2484_12700 [Clostridia bacterium]|nr:hypothetical protein [Clostridia bacterium]
MRLVARLPDERQVSALVDSLRNIGFDRGDMIISSLAEEKKFDSVEEATDMGISMIKTERDGLNDFEPFWEGVKGLKGDYGILVAVKTPKHEASKIREIMEQSGALEIVQD